MEILHSRRTIHDSIDEEIPKEDLISTLATAITSPNHKFTFPWKFVVVGPESRQEIVELMIRLKLSKGGSDLLKSLYFNIQNCLCLFNIAHKYLFG